MFAVVNISKYESPESCHQINHLLSLPLQQFSLQQGSEEYCPQTTHAFNHRCRLGSSIPRAYHSFLRPKHRNFEALHNNNPKHTSRPTSLTQFPWSAIQSVHGSIPCERHIKKGLTAPLSLCLSFRGHCDKACVANSAFDEERGKGESSKMKFDVSIGASRDRGETCRGRIRKGRLLRGSLRLMNLELLTWPTVASGLDSSSMG